MNAENIKVSVVIPVLNEEKYIVGLMDSLLKQDYDKSVLEIILVDGNSDDNTVSIINEYIKDHNIFKLLSNPKRTVQHALNIGMRAACGKYIVRMDAHAIYADNYISKCIEYLEKTDAVNVGGPMIAKGNTPVQRAIAAAYHSSFALGGGKFHQADFEGYADTVFLGAFKKETLEKLNYYDPNLSRSEDDDLNFRLNEQGYRIYITPEIKSIYYPRSDYVSLFKQYFEYGEWKVAVIRKHHKPARISHLIPFIFVIFLTLGLILSIISALFIGGTVGKLIPIIYGTVCSVYLIIDAIVSLSNKNTDNFSDRLRLFWIHIILHLSYGLGFIKGIFRFRKFPVDKE